MRSASTQRGSVLLVVIGLIFIIAVTGVAMISITGADSAASGKASKQESAMACAEAGLQYGRAFFASKFLSTNSWNDYLSGARPGRYDPVYLGDGPAVGPTKIGNLAAIGGPCPLELQGDSDCNGALDPGMDLDGDGKPDFLVTIRDNDDERSVGVADNRTRDNDQIVILRAECTNPRWATTINGVSQTAVIESTLHYIAAGNNSNNVATGNYGTSVGMGNVNGGP